MAVDFSCSRCMAGGSQTGQLNTSLVYFRSGSIRPGDLGALSADFDAPGRPCQARCSVELCRALGAFQPCLHHAQLILELCQPAVGMAESVGGTHAGAQLARAERL